MTTTRIRAMGGTALALAVTMLAAGPALASVTNDGVLRQYVQSSTPIAAADFQQGTCPVPDGIAEEDVEAWQKDNDSWHFIAPGNDAEFTELTAYFDTDGDGTFDVVRTLADAIQHPDASHAYVSTPVTDPATTLVLATATVVTPGDPAPGNIYTWKAEDPAEFETYDGWFLFNLSHTCAGEGGGDPVLSTIDVFKYYDFNRNGEHDPGEPGLQGWTIQSELGDVTTDADGVASYADVPVGSYSFAELVGQAPWVQTGNTVNVAAFNPANSVDLVDFVYDVTLTVEDNITGLDFGNVCAVSNTGGKTLGFWSNKNGGAILKANPGRAALVNAIKPVNAKGVVQTFSFADAAGIKTFQKWLLDATSVNASYMLSVQLSATILNVAAGTQSGADLVEVDGSWITIDQAIADASAFLIANPITTSAGQARTTALMYKDVFDGLNNNVLPVTPTDPTRCGAPYAIL
jgi:hypothetical protein